jgi:hypothetical protein
VTGGKAPYTWSVSAGSLPAGLNLSAGGVISGTPTTAGTNNFTVQVVDSVGGMATQPLQIVVASTLTITTSSLPGATANAPYTQTLQSAGGTAPYTWSISAGNLPTGLSLSAAGVISGTCHGAGTTDTFTVKVTDAAEGTATRQFSIVSSPPPIITTSTLPSGVTGSPYNQTLQVTRGTSPYAWSISTGTLPRGLSLSAGGAISGTPITTGTSNFTAQVSDANTSVTTQALSILIVSPAQPPTCTLSVQGTTDPLTVTAVASCTDPQGESLTTSISWGDNSSPTTGSGGTLTASHTYAQMQSAQSYSITVTSTDTSGLPGTASGSVLIGAQPVFAGQSSTTSATTTFQQAAIGKTVTFSCQSVSGTNISGSELPSKIGISCSFNPASLTLTNTSVGVAITIQTTGSATASLVSPFSRRFAALYVACFPLAGFLFLGLTSSIRGSNRRKLAHYLGFGLLCVLLVLLVACGGGFTPPSGSGQGSQAHASTAPGNYVVTVVAIDSTQFVQTSLIVPLTVTSPAP